MNFELDTVTIQCPYCWESFDTTLDYSALEPHGAAQQYTEDCYVCCRPIVLNLTLDEHGVPQLNIEAELS